MENLKILSFSDIHIDINSIGSFDNGEENIKFLDGFKLYLNQLKDIDLVICAGDISPRLNQIKELLDLVTDSVKAKNYVFVPGNHDVWEIEEKVEDGVSRIKYEDLIPEVVTKTKFHYLPGNPLIIDNKVALFGDIGWYDYTFRNKKWDDYLKKDRKTWYYAKTLDGAVWNDAMYAEWGMHDLDVVKYCINNLVKDYEKIKHIPNKIACLHHIPFKEGVHTKDDISWDYFSAFMGSEQFGEKLIEWNVDLVTYGHTHFPHSYTVKNCRAYCTAIGYQNEWKSDNLMEVFANTAKVIDYKINNK